MGIILMALFRIFCIPDHLLDWVTVYPSEIPVKILHLVQWLGMEIPDPNPIRY
jgi:hypothetical protein